MVVDRHTLLMIEIRKTNFFEYTCVNLADTGNRFKAILYEYPCITSTTFNEHSTKNRHLDLLQNSRLYPLKLREVKKEFKPLEELRNISTLNSPWTPVCIWFQKLLEADYSVMIITD
ncbi:hypothetical protein RF11_15445 [Thelohanellus kitauei]|uniref:Uncharacterized protein n=1 Tax=Thelohanellus kitauei TaxID=669202 RepID=A0A0C2MJT5_THEKT|nr:hypothetical protein RF11_15445 [Thelohanellus kitauei]